MKKILLIVFVIYVSSIFAETISLDTPMGSFKASISGSDLNSANSVSVIDEIANRLEILESKFHKKLNKLDQKRSNKIVEEIYELLALLPDDVTMKVVSETTTSTTTTTSESSANSNVNININVNEQEDFQQEEIEIESHSSNSAMSNNEFRTLYNNVENESFSDDQLSVVRIATGRKYFTINQLTQLIGLFSFSDEKIQCVQIVYPKIVDKDNAHNLLGAFTYSDDKKQVENIINRY
ncbi:MAG: DUF4476 domain-containing protein [Candidatus Cloacimonetes bacterium]|nr:DUF4476 domain-containing protein [Candidatus Cloacimonadota bacterium]